MHSSFDNIYQPANQRYPIIRYCHHAATSPLQNVEHSVHEQTHFAEQQFLRLHKSKVNEPDWILAFSMGNFAGNSDKVKICCFAKIYVAVEVYTSQPTTLSHHISYLFPFLVHSYFILSGAALPTMYILVCMYIDSLLF